MGAKKGQGSQRAKALPGPAVPETAQHVGREAATERLIERIGELLRKGPPTFARMLRAEMETAQSFLRAADVVAVETGGGPQPSGATAEQPQRAEAPADPAAVEAPAKEAGPQAREKESFEDRAAQFMFARGPTYIQEMRDCLGGEVGRDIVEISVCIPNTSDLLNSDQVYRRLVFIGGADTAEKVIVWLDEWCDLFDPHGVAASYGTPDAEPATADSAEGGAP